MERTKEAYACSYTEVMEVLASISIEELKKIPKDVLEFFYANMDKEYKFRIEPYKPLKLQVSELTKIIIANLYRDYLATPMERRRIIEREHVDMQKREEELRAQYDPSKLFVERKEVSSQKNLPAVVKKDTLFEKIKMFLRRIFHIKSDNIGE